MKYERTMEQAHLYWSYSAFADLARKLIKKLELTNLSELMRYVILDRAYEHGLVSKAEYDFLRILAKGKSGAMKRKK